MKEINGLFRLLAVLILAVVVTGCGSSSDSDDSVAEGETFNLDLSSRFTVPAVSADGTGTAAITLNRDSGSLSGSVTVSDLTGEVSAAHIHHGLAGKTGGIIITLETDAGDASTLNVPDGTVLDSTQMDALSAAEYYINVHTAANASGEIRGQILPADYEVMQVELKGENQVPEEVSSANSGIAYVTVNTVTAAISGNATNTGLDDASAVHIHSGFAGLNGSIVITLENDSANTANWDIPAATVLSEDELADLMAGEFYFNVHTPANASGEVRGQIAPSHIRVTRDELSGEEAVPAVKTLAFGVGYTTVDEETGGIEANVRTSGITATATHIHEAEAGSNGGIAVSLDNDAVDTDFWSASGALTAEQLEAFKVDGLYFNVHSAANPGGEIRAQINP